MSLKQRAIQFLEKEIKTYTALALFFSKKGIKESVKLEGKEILILVSAKVRGHSMFVVPALAGPPKGGTTNANVAMCSYLCSH